MLRLLRISIFVGFASLAFGQLDSNSVTVTATSVATVAPDQAIFSIAVGSDQNGTLNDVLTAVQSTGLAVGNLSGVNSFGASQPGYTWIFGLAVPLTQIKQEILTLTALEQSLPQTNKNLSLSFTIQGTQVSPQLQQAQACSYATLLASAQTQAQTLATAGGRTLSGVLALSSSTSNGGASSSLVTYNTTAQSCSITVKFALLGL